MRVTQVPRADLRAHVPAAEGGRRELQTPDFQQHVGHGREGIPAQAQGCEPLQSGGIRTWDQPLWSHTRPATPPPAPAPLCSRGVLQGHFEDQLGGQNKELWSLIWGLEQQGQHVEAAVSRGPAVLDAELRGAARGVLGPSPAGSSGALPPSSQCGALPLYADRPSTGPSCLLPESSLAGFPFSSPRAHLRGLHVGGSPVLLSPCHLRGLHVGRSPLLLSPCPPPRSPHWQVPLLLSPCPPP